jgi:hypothetical protein
VSTVDLRERDHLENPDIDGRIILKWNFKKWDWGMDWNDMAEDKDQWQALANVVMNFRVL